jgi:uncharacterized protein YbjT (DUF2867 family)
MSIRVVTVFGGTGFLGRRVVRHLREHEFSVRIASRHPDRSRKFLADYTINMFGSDFRQGQVHHWNLLLDLDQFAALKPAAMRS